MSKVNFFKHIKNAHCVYFFVLLLHYAKVQNQRMAGERLFVMGSQPTTEEAFLCCSLLMITLTMTKAAEKALKNGKGSEVRERERKV